VKKILLTLTLCSVLIGFVGVARAGGPGWLAASYWYNYAKTPEWPCRYSDDLGCGNEEFGHRLYFTATANCSGGVYKGTLLFLGGGWWNGTTYIYQATKTSMVALGCLSLIPCDACEQQNPYYACRAYNMYAYCSSW